MTRICILVCFVLAAFELAFPAGNLTQTDSEVAVLNTTRGKIVFEFYPNAAPNHVTNFKKLARQGFYDGTTFHRVMPGFMIQGGDPLSKDKDPANDGRGDAGYQLKAEFNDISHKRGIVSMARGDGPDSASCQFFIVQKDSPYLDHQYTVFGHVIQGMSVVDKIVKVKTVPGTSRPATPVVIKKVTIEKRGSSK